MTTLRIASALTAVSFLAACADSPTTPSASAPVAAFSLNSTLLGDFKGNISGNACEALYPGAGFLHGKVDFESTGPVESGDVSGFTYVLSADGTSVTITSAEGFSVSYVVVKGGDGYRVAEGSGTFQAPLMNLSRGRTTQPGVSHINVCYVPVPPMDVCEEPTVVTGLGDLAWVSGTSPTETAKFTAGGPIIKSDLGDLQNGTRSYTITADAYVSRISALLKGSTSDFLVDLSVGGTGTGTLVGGGSNSSTWTVTWTSRTNNGDGTYTYTVTVTGTGSPALSHATFQLGCD
jgi:hypothetical protein